MKSVICPICNNLTRELLKAENIQYYQCYGCQTVFCDPSQVDNEDKVGGQFEQERNETQNAERIFRIYHAIDCIKDGPNLMDFGCGNGMLIDDLKKDGFVNVDGFDPYNEKYSRLPEKEKYHFISAIEVIEHTGYPFVEIDVIYRSLLPGGVVMIETGFTDVAEEEGIPIDEYFYISPQAGHSTIFSHHGLDLLMALHGFKPIAHWNRHVRGYRKYNVFAKYEQLKNNIYQ